MRKLSNLSRLAAIALVAVLTLNTAVISRAAAQSPKTQLSVAVFAEHYVLAGRLIDDLDVLESAIRAAGATAVRLDACGAGTSRAQQAAAHRFRNVYMEMRILRADEPGCDAAVIPQVMPVSTRLGARPYNIDDAAVRTWWYQLMP